ncbi:hypothetical protein [Paenibacillus tianjinensis]|uniref:Uncharacterized protein n=1 Tax=Paenibacillus tianjinensis TaxID=2810347 RepID=A0ABX7L4E2_9BACL|nr:hypothetical protein [Paenibacillus tianjinensis]QSF42653.1 hypothetical protein JRJ22_15150 [Paenibacillus tianjinensis]
MAFARRVITKTLDLLNLQRHNDNFADIETDLTEHRGRISTAETNINTLDGRVDNIVASSGESNLEIVDAREDYTTLRERLDTEHGAVSAQLADIVTLKPSGGDDAALVQILLNLGRKVALAKDAGSFHFNSIITVPSNAYLDGQNAEIITNTSRVFYFASGTQKPTIINITLNNVRSGTTHVFYIDGENTSYATSIKDVFIENIVANNYTWFAYCKCLRKSTFNQINSYAANGIYYTDKSAEVNITNSYFVNDEAQSRTGTKGLYAIANGTHYPEGLVLSNTLFYHFERNYQINDLFIGMFSNVYFDCGGVGCLPLLVDRNEKIDGLKFNNVWIYTLGMEFGHIGPTSPQSYRSSFNGIHFQLQKAGTTIMMHPWVQDIVMSDLHFDSDITGTHIGIVLENQNSYVNINNANFRYYESYVQCKGLAHDVSLSNVPNADNLAYPFYFEYAVNGNLTNNSQEHQWSPISQSSIIAAGTTIKQLSAIWLGRGRYMLRTSLNTVALTAGGTCRLEINTTGVTTPGVAVSAGGSGYDSRYFDVDVSEKNIRFSNVFEVTSEGQFNLILKSEDTPAGTVNGYHSIVEIIKL